MKLYSAQDQNPQFSSNQPDIQELLVTHKVIIVINFPKDRAKFVDFFIKSQFLVVCSF